MSVSGFSPFGTIEEIFYDLFGSKTPPSSADDAFIKSNLVRYRMVLQNYLRPYQDSLPYALNSITEDLNEACNLLVERKYHISKTHWDDARALKEQFDIVWTSIIEYLKAIPTQRLQPQSVSGNFANSSVLLKNINGLTDNNGNLLPGF